MRKRWAVGVSLLAALFPASALAHDGHFAKSGDLGEALSVWSPDPGAIVLIALVGGLYAWGYRRLRVQSPGFRFPRWHPVAFGSGIVLLLISLVSPIDTYSDDLFWVHMVQHMVIVMLVAPLLLLGAR